MNTALSEADRAIYLNRSIADTSRKVKALCEDNSEWQYILNMTAGLSPIEKLRILRGQYDLLARRAVDVDEYQTVDGVFCRSYHYQDGATITDADMDIPF